MSHTYAEIASDWTLWAEFADPDATMTRAKFEATPVDDRIALLQGAHGLRSYAIIDTHAGFLQWLGVARSGEDAIRRLDADVGLTRETVSDLLVGEVTEEQAVALQAWWDSGGHACAFPSDVRLSRVDASDIRAAIDGASA